MINNLKTSKIDDKTLKIKIIQLKNIKSKNFLSKTAKKLDFYHKKDQKHKLKN